MTRFVSHFYIFFAVLFIFFLFHSFVHSFHPIYIAILYHWLRTENWYSWFCLCLCCLTFWFNLISFHTIKLLSLSLFQLLISNTLFFSSFHFCTHCHFVFLIKINFHLFILFANGTLNRMCATPLNSLFDVKKKTTTPKHSLVFFFYRYKCIC